MKQNLETTVGFFLMGGLAVICALIIFFGEVGDYFKPTYSLTVRFPNASGLLKGSDVYLSGAQIGKVSTDPHLIPDTQKVEVMLKINGGVRIREDAKYVIGSAGLLGDKFVDVQPVVYPDGTPDDQKKPYVKDGEVIEGAKTASLDDLTNSAQPLVEKANQIADQLNDVISKLNNDLLSDSNTKDLQASLANLRDMIKNANDVLEQAKNSKGPFGRLINDKQAGQNLVDFIANLKEHGPIFYSDTAAEDRAKPKDGKR